MMNGKDYKVVVCGVFMSLIEWLVNIGVVVVIFFVMLIVYGFIIGWVMCFIQYYYGDVFFEVVIFVWGGIVMLFFGCIVCMLIGIVFVMGGLIFVMWFL